MSHPDVIDSLQAGREAARRHSWREAFDLLTAADASGDLSPEDLETLAEVAFWTGRLPACIDAYERAYAAYLDREEHGRAGIVALALAREYQHKLASSIAAGWFKRAKSLLEENPESVEYGYLVLARVSGPLAAGDLEGALEHARQAVEIGRRFGDRDLEALGLHKEGCVLVAKGDVPEGLALLDEATVAAVSGGLRTLTTAIIYCNTIDCCRDLADYRRAGEWTEVATRWCERQAIHGFPGICRVRRAEVMRLRGAWAEAEQEARRACDELREAIPNVAAEAFYEIGEIRLRLGDLPAAEEAFRQAHELGRSPQPGLSLLRLAEGKAEAATSSIRGELEVESWDRLARARLLPARVEIALAVRDLEGATSAVQELEEIVKTYTSPALEAVAACTRGAVQLEEGDWTGAMRRLRRGWQIWRDLDMPYEAAKARMQMAAGYAATGDEEAARLELEAARSAFERLGALPDARRAAEILGGEAGGDGRPSAGRAPRATRTFMFTDIVKSTNLVEAIGDDAWEDLLRWHDQTLRSLFAAHGGEEIKQVGDGFFVGFREGREAIECAVAIQRKLTEHRRDHGFAPQVRIGLHTAEAAQVGRDYGGRGVHEAARIGALAEGGEILTSRETLPSGALRFAVSEPRSVSLKGISAPVDVVAIDWR